MAEQLTIRQWEEYEGENWWKWAVWLEGPDASLDLVDFVEWRLHPTFPTPVRRTTDRASKFRLQTEGWGGFNIFALVHMKDGDSSRLTHTLSLHYPDGTATSA